MEGWVGAVTGVSTGSAQVLIVAPTLLPCSVLLTQGLAVKSSGCPVLTVLLPCLSAGAPGHTSMLGNRQVQQGGAP